MFQIFRVKQLRQWAFFDAIWLWHLGILRMLHTKHWFALISRIQLLFGICIMKLRLHREGAEDGCQVDRQAMEEYK